MAAATTITGDGTFFICHSTMAVPVCKTNLKRLEPNGIDGLCANAHISEQVGMHYVPTRCGALQVQWGAKLYSLNCPVANCGDVQHHALRQSVKRFVE